MLSVERDVVWQFLGWIFHVPSNVCFLFHAIKCFLHFICWNAVMGKDHKSPAVESKGKTLMFATRQWFLIDLFTVPGAILKFAWHRNENEARGELQKRLTRLRATGQSCCSFVLHREFYSYCCLCQKYSRELKCVTAICRLIAKLQIIRVQKKSTI